MKRIRITIGIVGTLLLAIAFLFLIMRERNTETWSVSNAKTEWGDADIRLTLRNNGRFVNRISYAQANTNYVIEGNFTKTYNSVILHYDSGKTHTLEVRGDLLVDKFSDGEVVMKRKLSIVGH